MQKVLALLTLTIILTPLSSQTLSFVDKESGEGINGLMLQIQELNGGLVESLVTAADGKVSGKFNFPIAIVASHLGFEAFSDTLQTAKDYRFGLTPKVLSLEEVVVTGQFVPQSARNSVFKVRQINAEEIQRRGAVTLEEAINNQLNIRVNQDLAIGSSTISLQGISSQNVKILLDGVPLVNRTGNGNGADLSQINLQNIERIEVVEGPMAVNFGANALAGVINLISKKDFDHSTEIQAVLQTESAGNEWGTNGGRHIASINFNHQFNENWSTLVGLQRNDFRGFQGIADERQHEWNPKAQVTGNALLKYQNARHSFHYRIDILDELIEDFGSLQNNFLPSGENQPFAIDENFKSVRHSHQLQAEGSFSFLPRYTAFASYSDFERQKNRFSKNVVTGTETLTSGIGDQDLSTYKVWEFGGTGFLNPTSNLDFQIGYQITAEEVGGGRILNESQSIQEYGFYSSMEWRPSQKLTIRPGLRYNTNSAFGGQLVPSLQLKQAVSDKTQLRLSYGRGFRSPSVRELYFEFVDSNHRIFGNPDLNPETSNHFSINTTSEYLVRSNPVKAELNFFYNNIEDQIAIGQNVNDVTSATYININKFKTLGVSLSQSAVVGRFKANLGFSYIGRYNRLTETEGDLASFFYSPEVNANIFYNLPNERTNINLFYKYTGRLQSYFTDTNEQNEEVVNIGEISDYHWIDATINHKINDALQLVLGARNALNITQINNSGLTGGAHSGGPQVPVSYGRSYFLKLSYNLNLK